MSGEDVIVRPARRDELTALAEALVETSAAQLENRWREQELGYRELLLAEQAGEYVGTVSIGYTILAKPLAMNQTGIKAFCAEEDAVLRVDLAGACSNTEAGILGFNPLNN